MPHYHRLGKIPHKRHTQFRKPDGGLYSEQLFSTEGFSSNSTLFYHINPPTQIIKIGEPVDVSPKAAADNILKPRSFQGFKITHKKEYLDSRKVVLFNNDIQMTLAAPEGGLAQNSFFKNADADEIIFVHRGTGVLKTQYGQITFGYGDYLVIPRGCIYQIEFNDKDNRLLIVDAFSPIRFPKRYLSPYGQVGS